MQGTAASSRKQTEGKRLSVSSKETGGLRGGVPEQGAPGQDSLLPSDINVSIWKCR